MASKKSIPESTVVNATAKGRKITGSADVYDVLLKSWEENKTGITPGVKLLLLDKEDQVIGLHHLLNNQVPCLALNAQEIVSSAIKENAHSFIFARCKTWESLTPSVFDYGLAETLSDFGQQEGVLLLDYFIVSSKGYFSCMDDGLHPRQRISIEDCIC